MRKACTVFTLSPLRRVIVLSEGSSRRCPGGERHAGKLAARRHLRGPGRHNLHVADGHRIAAQPRAEADTDGQFFGPFQKRAAGHAFQPRLHLPGDLTEVESQKPGSRLVYLPAVSLGVPPAMPVRTVTTCGHAGRGAQVVARPPQRVDVLPTSRNSTGALTGGPWVRPRMTKRAWRKAGRQTRLQIDQQALGCGGEVGADQGLGEGRA
jgi:hypothetical protein